MDYHTYYAGENGAWVYNMCNTAKNTAAEAVETLADAVNKSGSTSSRIEFVNKEEGTFIIKDWSDYPND